MSEALARAREDLEQLAARLQAEDRHAEAEIVSTGVLLAEDPALAAAATAAVREGHTAPSALLEAAGDFADRIAALDDPLLAARADDVRSVGRRAARYADAGASPSSNGHRAAGHEIILVAAELGPADVAELGDEVAGIALARGSVTAHAAIVARSLGLPLVVQAGSGLLALTEGDRLVVDGSQGEVVTEPDDQRATAAQAAASRRAGARARALAARDLPAQTRDGRRLLVLTNAATPAEVVMGLDAGAEGAGLIRTELSFLDTPAWPTEEQHSACLEPLLAPLAGRVATVRVLDYGGDKTPPFLSGTRARGLELLLEHPEALSAQLRAILVAGQRTRLRVLLPMVRHAEELLAVRRLLAAAVAASGSSEPALGAMVELPEAAACAAALAGEADFLSIGTNDLTHSTLGSERFAGGTGVAHDPRVLRLIAATARAGADARLPVEVCGEASSEPLTAPLMVGLGATELSVGAARVGVVREWVRSLDFSDVRALAARALRADDAAAVERLAAPLAGQLELLESGDAG